MQPFTSYYQNQQRDNLINSLQQNIGYMQSQLQQLQSQQIPQQLPIQQQMQSIMPAQNMGVNTRIVDGFESISANDVPMDNNGAFFVKKDGSEIQHRKWGADGKIIPISYKPILDGQIEDTINSSNLQENFKIELSDDAKQTFIQRFDDITNRLDVIEQFLNKPTAKNTVAKAKKEAE